MRSNVLSQHFTNLSGQFVNVERLLEKFVATAVHNLLGLAFDTVAAGKDNL